MSSYKLIVHFQQINDGQWHVLGHLPELRQKLMEDLQRRVGSAAELDEFCGGVLRLLDFGKQSDFVSSFRELFPHVGASDQTLRAWVADHVAARSAIPDVKAVKYRKKNSNRTFGSAGRQLQRRVHYDKYCS